MNLKPIIFSGSSNPQLSRKINEYLNLIPGEVSLKRFSDGEIWVKFRENIRGRDVFIVQSTQQPSDFLMELLIMIDAAKRSSAKRITAVLPYFGYARQDRKDQPRVSITAKLIANLITTAGADRVLTMDLHAAQIQGFFDIPLDHLYASPIFTNIFKERKDDIVVVSPDVGGIKLARSYAQKIGGAPLVLIDKRRPEPNIAEVMNIIGEVKGKNVLLVDDLIDTGGTFVGAIEALKERGAKEIYGAVTHPLLSGEAIERLEKSALTKLYVTDSIPLPEGKNITKIVPKTSSAILAEAIIRIHRNESISSLFEVNKD
ncbi:MAG: ribose-phosphate pyrophosphokinase [Melioribacteraceae bacterium]|nr:ribose-phosphate pyrophosphokinase [Melioribacteraceae bacterium]